MLQSTGTGCERTLFGGFAEEIHVGAEKTSSDRFLEVIPVGAAVAIPAEFGVVWNVEAEEGILEEAEQALAVRFGLHRVGFEGVYRVALGADDRVGEG